MAAKVYFMAALIDGVVDDLANLIEIVTEPVLPSDLNSTF